MEDRELLELAAKAVGYTLVWGDVYIVDGENIDCTDLPYVRSNQQDEADWYWNPLEDDGDALRLVAALKLNIEHMETMGRKSYGINCWPYGRGDCGATETEIADYQAALRRAIVRAAAEIGKQMP